MIDGQDYCVINPNEIKNDVLKIAEHKEQMSLAIQANNTSKVEELLPYIMKDQFNEISNLGKKVNEAMDKAASAKDRAEQKIKPILFKKAAAIEALQNTTYEIADAQVTVVDAQTLIFNYLNKIGEITKYLFSLGISNIAMNRMVVRELELRLKGASEEELSDLAKQELMGVIRQLKAQEDIMEKQEKTLSIVKDHDTILSELQNDSLEKGMQISQQTRKLEAQEKLIAKQIEKINEHGSHLANLDKKNDEYNAFIAKQVKLNEEQNKKILEIIENSNKQNTLIAIQIEKSNSQAEFLKILDEKAKKQDILFAELCNKSTQQNELLTKESNKNISQDTLIEELIQKNAQQKQQINLLQNDIESLKMQLDIKLNKNTLIIPMVISAFSLILTILHFFI